MVLPALLFFLISSCSSPEDQEKKGVIEQTTETVAQEAVDRIKTPIDKAYQAKDLQESHTREVDESTERQ